MLAVLTRIVWQQQGRVERWIQTYRFGAHSRWPNETRIQFLDRLQSEQEDASLVGEVVLKTARPNGAVRYIGVVDEIRLNADDTIASISLLEPMELVESPEGRSERPAFDGSGGEVPFKIHGQDLIGAAFRIIDQSDVQDYDDEYATHRFEDSASSPEDNS